MQHVNQLPKFLVKISRSKKEQWINILQSSIDRVKLELGEEDLFFEVNDDLVQNVKSLSWSMTTNDDVTSGLNIFTLTGKADQLNRLTDQAA